MQDHFYSKSYNKSIKIQTTINIHYDKILWWGLKIISNFDLVTCFAFTCYLVLNLNDLPILVIENMLEISLNMVLENLKIVRYPLVKSEGLLVHLEAMMC